tara:strand:+ start:5062 stop:6108 length:1047 start_codon:yes stop_codon:yes gene_type:complete
MVSKDVTLVHLKIKEEPTADGKVSQSISGVDYHRLYTPYKRIIDQGGRVQFFGWEKDDDGNTLGYEMLKQFDLSNVKNLVIGRFAQLTNHKAFKKWLRDRDVRLIVDNDDYWELQSDNPAREYYRKVAAPNIISCIEIADVITTPSQYLRDKMSEIRTDAEFVVIHNALDPDSENWSWQSGYEKDFSEAKFGYVGALGHKKDLQTMSVDWTPYNLNVVDLGTYPQMLNAKSTMPVENIFQYGNQYKEFNISLCPVKSNVFTRCKSPLKVAEAVYTDTAVIATDATPYREFIEDGKTGLLCKHHLDWRKKVKMLHESPSMAEDLVEASKDKWKKFFHIDTQNELRKQIL